MGRGVEGVEAWDVGSGVGGAAAPVDEAGVEGAGTMVGGWEVKVERVGGVAERSMVYWDVSLPRSLENKRRLVVGS